MKNEPYCILCNTPCKLDETKDEYVFDYNCHKKITNRPSQYRQRASREDKEKKLARAEILYSLRNGLTEPDKLLNIIQDDFIFSYDDYGVDLDDELVEAIIEGWKTLQKTKGGK